METTAPTMRKNEALAKPVITVDKRLSPVGKQINKEIILADPKINLLLVDDEQPLLDSIKRRLDIRNFNVIIADRGEKALDIARENKIDVAVVDLKMPGLSGKEVILSLKKFYPWLEIIILTGHGSFDPEKEDFFRYAFSFLVKPCDLETLLAVSINAYRQTIINKYNLSPKQIEELFNFQTINQSEEIINLIEIEHKLSGPHPEIPDGTG